MANLEQLRAKLGGYLDGLVSLDEFEDWFLSNTWNSHLHSDEETVKMVHRIEGNLLDFGAGAITESSLRKELALAARPSASCADRFSFGFASDGSYRIAQPLNSDFIAELKFS
jgi:hypothetical protein